LFVGRRTIDLIIEITLKVVHQEAMGVKKKLMKRDLFNLFLRKNFRLALERLALMV